MSSIRTNRFWQILYPLLIYYFLYHSAYLLLRAWLKENCSALFCLMLAALITLPALYGTYRKLPVVKAAEPIERALLPKEILGILAVVLLGIALNVAITQSGLLAWSEGYRASQKTLGGGLPAVRLLANGLVIPLLEELLYRGTICGQLDLWYGKVPAVLISSFLFGMMHFNIVQFLYAFLMGLALGSLYISSRKLWLPAAAHGLTNLVMVIYTLCIG